MVAAIVVLALVLVVAFESLILWLDQLHRTRREAAYWHQVEHRPPLYDWAREFDL